VIEDQKRCPGPVHPMIRIRLCENMRATGYAPLYFALSNGHFEDAGVTIDLITSPSPSRTGAMLLEGQAEISWGGPMRVMMHHQADPACPLVCFAQIVARDPFVLIGRRPNPRFRFHDLLSQRVAAASEAPTPWLMFQDDLGRAGIDPASLRRVPNQTMKESAAALLAGTADVVQVFEPFVEQLTAAGCHIWHRFSVRGDIAYTTFYATRDFIAAQRDACCRLVRGMAEAQRAFHVAEPASIATVIHPYFPDCSLALLTRIIAGYRGASVWAHTPALPVAAFLRLKAALISGGLIDRDLPFDRIIDPGLSRTDPT
jgi:NitT/TauT family transport system substrate-binding protein